MGSFCIFHNRIPKEYDRNKAIAYADTYYHTRSSKWYNFSDEGGNCQNYASQCMLEGGIDMDYTGDEQWKCYITDPDYEPEINEEDSPYGRTRSWVNVNYFYNYAKYNEGKGLVADTDVNLYYAQPGDIILVGNNGMSHTVIVSKVVDGHILVIPKKHCKSILDCDPETLCSVMQAVQTVSNHLTKHCGYEGVNILNASDESAGQSVSHFHMHIIPRREDDGIDAWPRFEGAKDDIQSVFEKVKM